MFKIRRNELRKQRAVVIRLEISIEEGKVGVGCISDDMRTYVGDREQILTAGDANCEVPVDVQDGSRWLVIRNVLGSGSSTINLSGIRTYRAERVLRPQV